jgi:glycosyltransferase involved in cell wall biosynthesis
MPRYANWLAKGMKERGHSVELWAPSPLFYRMPLPVSLKKWAGYIDQYIFFPFKVKKRIRKYPADTLFVFTDHALGPWVPLLASRRHVIHCHDFLAQQSAAGLIVENPITWSGRKYQEYIRNGYNKGRNFISISKNTQKDLHFFLKNEPNISEVVYNGLTQPFTPSSDIAATRKEVEVKTGVFLMNGYLLHVGGNQWYKNRCGVIDIYNEWRQTSAVIMPLVLLGAPPNTSLLDTYNNSPFKNDIHFLTNISDEFVRKIYAGASIFLFPSLAEGFGWPIAEAMASGCPVITTNEAPMNEVGGGAAFYISKKPLHKADILEWAKKAAIIINEILELTPEMRKAVLEIGKENAQRFDSLFALDKIEQIYKNIPVNR